MAFSNKEKIVLEFCELANKSGIEYKVDGDNAIVFLGHQFGSIENALYFLKGLGKNSEHRHNRIDVKDLKDICKDLDSSSYSGKCLNEANNILKNYDLKVIPMDRGYRVLDRYGNPSNPKWQFKSLESLNECISHLRGCRIDL